MLKQQDSSEGIAQEYDRQQHGSLKDFLTSRIATEMKLPKHVVDAVVTDQFKGIIKAFQVHNSVEMTGFGKWIFMDKRAQGWTEMLERLIANDALPNGISMENAQKDLDTIKKRLEKITNNHVKDKADSRGLEERNSEE